MLIVLLLTSLNILLLLLLLLLLVLFLNGVMIQNIELLFFVVQSKGECRFDIIANIIFNGLDFMGTVNTLLIIIY